MDLRIIGATNYDLVAFEAEGRIKQDLLNRLSFEALFLPPLRERKKDILLLANYFAVRMAFDWVERKYSSSMTKPLRDLKAISGLGMSVS